MARSRKDISRTSSCSIENRSRCATSSREGRSSSATDTSHIARNFSRRVNARFISSERRVMADERNVGRLLAIGGGEEPDEDHMQILPYFVEMCGKRSARIIVCGASSEKPKEKERKYRALFEKIGVADVYEASIAERHDGEDASLVDCARRATGVFFTGGDQLRLTSLVAGTKFGDVVADRLFNDGLVVGGTSAGAAAMSSTMVISGSSEGTVRRKDVQLAPGLNYW